MADLTIDEVMDYVSKKAGPQPDSTITTVTTPSLVSLDVKPSITSSVTQQALQDSQSQLNAVTTASLPRPEVPQDVIDFRNGKRQGVPLDETTGASFASRLAEQFTLNQGQTAWALKKLNPNVTDVRFNSYGEPILSVKDPTTGAQKDILANPKGLDAGDFTYLLANAPLLFGGGVAAQGVKFAPPVIGEGLSAASKLARWFLGSKDIVPMAARTAIAAEGLQAGRDVAQQALMGAQGDLPPEGAPGHLSPGETIADIVTKRGENVLPDVVFGAALGVGGKLLSKVASPFGEGVTAPLQVNAKAAETLLKSAAAKAGTPWVQEITPGEATGAAPLMRLEAVKAQLPGSAGVFHNFTTAKIVNDATVKNIMLGAEPSAVPPADLVGQGALEAIGAKLRPLDTVMDRETQNVLDAANTAIKTDAAKAAGVLPENVSVSAVGKQLMDGAQARYDQFKAASTALYNRVKQSPLVAGQGRNIDATPLAKDAQAILDSIPAVEKQVETPTALLDQFGNPGTIAETKIQPLNSFVENDAIKRLRDLANAEGGKVSLKDLMEARTDIGDSLSRGSVLGGVPERRLSDIYGALTERIKTGLNELDSSGGLLQDWTLANKHHADQIAKFKDTEILPIFKSAEKAGAQSPYDVVNKALNDPGKWDAYRDFFGANSEEFKAMKGAYANKLMGRVIGSNTINLQGFSDRLDTAYNSTPNILLDTFGDKLIALKKMGQIGGGALKGNVNADELNQLITGGISPTQQAVQRLEAAQIARDALNRSSYFSKIAKGDYSEHPSQFVDNFIFSKQAEPSDVRHVVALLADKPELVRQMQQRALLKIFSEATTSPQAGEEYLYAKGLSKFLTDQPGDMVASRLEALLGSETMTLLKAVHDIRLPGDVKSEVYKGAGSWGATSQLTSIEKGNVVQFATGVLKSFALASLYTSGVTRAYLANGAMVQGAKPRAALEAVLFSSPAFITDMMRTFTGDSGRVAAVQMKSIVDRAARQADQPEPSLADLEKYVKEKSKK
jgi:hypothetical protein